MASSNYPKLEGEQYCGPHLYRGFDDDGVYQNFLEEFTHYPNDYDHGSSATVYKLSPVDENPLSSRVDNSPLDAFAEPPGFKPRLSLGLFHNHQDLPVDGAFCTEGPSPPPPRKPLHDVYGPLPGSSPEIPLQTFTTDQVRMYASRRQPPFNDVYIVRIPLGFASVNTP